MRLLALLACLGLLAAACGGSDSDSAGDDAEASADAEVEEAMDDEEPADEPEPEPEEEEEEASEPEPADEDEQAVDTTLDEEELEEIESDDAEAGAVDSGPIAGGSLLIGSTQVPRHLNGTVQSGLATAVPGTQLNASPLLFDENFNPQPYLAESWEVAEDGLSVTLNLVQGAVFHDGEAITSEDVKFSIETAQAGHPFKTMFAPVTDVETPDDHTVIINLSQPHPAILLAMSPGLLPIIPEHIFNDGTPVAEHPRNTEDFVGSGPFRLVEYEAGSVIRMERFEDFFIPERPYLDEIIIQISPDPASIVLGLEGGDIDMSTTLGSAANIIRVRDNDDLILTAEGHEAIGPVNWLEFNLEDEVLSDVRVRQAIAYAVDRDFLSDVIDQGTTFPVTTGIVPASPFHNADAEAYAADQDRARELLAEAGYADGELSLAIDYIPPGQQATAEYIVQALQDVGINAELNVSPDFPSWAGRVAGGEHQLTVNQVWNWGDPVIGVHRTYLSSNRVGAIWTNNTGYANDEVDALLDAAGQEVDRDARIALYADAQAIIAEDAPIHFLSTSPFWMALNPRVQNPPIGIWGSMSPMLDVWLAE
ncbi:MAG: ABC transporter substrate-binding protein [Actinomycetota bacterium]